MKRYVFINIFLFSQREIYGAEIEVSPGDNITLICDRTLTHGYNIAWIRNCSHEHQPSLIIDHLIMDETNFPRFSFLKNSNMNSFDLHITNITVSDLGLYYCAEYKRQFNGIMYTYHYGNRTTRLSLAVTSGSGPSSTVSPSLVSDCFLCWTLLFSVCPVCVLLSSICVYCLCQKKTTGCENSAEMLTINVFKADLVKHRCEMSKTGKLCLHSEVMYRLLPSAHPYDKM
ncbi:hypothetical protein IRJ41_005042 [Triplophysa rosa]|uniref:Ig-like domain-containing protein n=1 Tax=Triplophysa rosa TaxID=992332 RepID=A0A9W7WYI3_TRIRA|nr:hypothetical protein IRJ41_005042 [Triplophysa rosa]